MSGCLSSGASKPESSGQSGNRSRAAIDQIPQQHQRQDSLADQLRDVRRAATRLGCYDAADWILRREEDGARVRAAIEAAPHDPAIMPGLDR